MGQQLEVWVSNSERWGGFTDTHSISGTVVLLLGLHGCRFPSLSTLPGPRVLTATLDLEGYGGERESVTL